MSLDTRALVPALAPSKLSCPVTEISQKKSPGQANSFRFRTSNPVNAKSGARPAIIAIGPSNEKRPFHELFTEWNETFPGDIRYIQ